MKCDYYYYYYYYLQPLSVQFRIDNQSCAQLDGGLPLYCYQILAYIPNGMGFILNGPPNMELIIFPSCSHSNGGISFIEMMF